MQEKYTEKLDVMTKHDSVCICFTGSFLLVCWSSYMSMPQERENLSAVAGSGYALLR